MAETTFVLLSFEGPDLYARAGGIGSRVDELSRALATKGFETHLFFIGDPEMPGHELAVGGKLHLHRWCQWISRYHPGGVYDGEEGKIRDWQDSLPDWLAREVLEPRVSNGEPVVVMAEEWHTAETIIRLRHIVERNGWQDRVRLLWNANNTFSFDRIDWRALNDASTLTTVSRYMKHAMWNRGVDPRVIPNGIDGAWLEAAPKPAVAGYQELFEGRLSMLKVGRFDPNKRWLAAVEAVADLKAAGARPLMVARGGNEGHGWEVQERALSLGLSVDNCVWPARTCLHEALGRHLDADIVFLGGHLGFLDRRVLYESCDAVLANSGIEPFGLVGLEAMASGGLVFVGSTGEDYSLNGHDSISLQTSGPGEIVHHVLRYARRTDLAYAMRQAAKAVAVHFTWSSVLARTLFPLLTELGTPVEETAAEPVATTAGMPVPVSLAAAPVFAAS